MTTMRRLLLAIIATAVGIMVWQVRSRSVSPPSGVGNDVAHHELELVAAGSEATPSALRQAAATTRSLRVVDEDGSVPPECRVEAWSLDGVQDVVRDAHGSWSIPAYECVVSVQAERFAPYVSRLRSSTDASSVVLRRPRSIALLVAKPEGAAPGVRVRLRSAVDGESIAIDSDFARQWCDANHQQRKSLFTSLGSEELGPRWTMDMMEARTDEQGWLRRELAASSVIIEIAGRRTVVCDQLMFHRSNAWSISQPIAVGPSGVALVAHLLPGAVVRGSVDLVESTAHGHVVLRHEMPGGAGIVVHDVEQECDLQDGRFTFEDVIPGAKTVVTTNWPQPNELEFAVAAFTVEQGQTVDLGVLRPDTGALDVEMAVVDATTNAVVDAPNARWDLIVGTTPQRGPVLAEGVRELVSSARLRVRGLPPGLVRVEAKLAQGAALPEGLAVLDSRPLQSEQPVQAAGAVRLEARVCRMATSTIEVAGVEPGARTQGELVDIENGARLPISLPLHREAAPRAFAGLPQLPRRYRFVVRSDSGATGALAVGEVSIVGGELVRLALVPAAAARASVRGSNGPTQGLRLLLAGVDDERVVPMATNGAASIRGLTPGVAYELRAQDKRLRAVAFEGTDDGVHRFTAGEAGSTVDLGVLVVRD